ncbi:MAG: autoinducer binding domain-containing protein [Caldimonas sp.]
MNSSPPSESSEPTAPDSPPLAYLARVPAIVQMIHATTDPMDAIDVLTAVTSELGADVSIFASFTRAGIAEDSYRVLLACDPAWRSDHEEAGWFESDPWLNYARQHSEPILASELILATDTERSMAEVAVRLGFASTVIAPALSNAEQLRVGVFCLGSATPGHFEHHPDPLVKAAVRLVAQELHEWWTAAMRDELVASARLSPEDILLLRHAHAGHGTKEIARATGWSNGSIDSRFQRLNARLGVATRKAAARLAAECNLI